MYLNLNINISRYYPYETINAIMETAIKIAVCLNQWIILFISASTIQITKCFLIATNTIFLNI